MKFMFLRHAQATHNSDAMVRGDIAYFDPDNADAALDAVGLEQLRGKSFPNDVIDAIYCSPLRRCRQTLLGILPTSENKIVHLDDRLMESQGTAVCNKRIAKHYIVQEVPSSWDTSGVADINPFGYATEGYSSDVVAPTDEFYRRVRRFAEFIIASHTDNHTILIVGHHDWIRAWFSIYTHMEVSPRNCEIIQTSFDSKKLMGGIGI